MEGRVEQGQQADKIDATLKIGNRRESDFVRGFSLLVSLGPMTLSGMFVSHRRASLCCRPHVVGQQTKKKQSHYHIIIMPHCHTFIIS